MKRLNIFLAGAFIATGSLFAQSDNAEWQAGLAKMKELIQIDSAQAVDEAGQLLKGKNKKNPQLIVAVARAFLDAGKLSEAEEYLTLAQRSDPKSALVSLLAGDIAAAKKDAGTACQMYEQAIYFDPQNIQAYLHLADIYKGSNPQEAIEKLEQLKAVVPTCALADKKLAEVYYMDNRFGKAAEVYARILNSPETTEDDLVKYAFALFLNHDFEKSLEVSNLGLERNAHHATFNRLAMYNYTDLKRYDEAQKAADTFFNAADKADYSYLDYMYYGHLLNALKKYDEAVMQYQKAIELDASKTELWREISDAYQQNNDYTDAIAAYLKYYESLPAKEQTPDLQFQIGKLYYGKGTQSDTLTVSLDDRKAALVSADSVFAVIAKEAPESYLGNFWRARAHSALDPETTQGLAKPYYEEVAALLAEKNDPRYNSALVECYSYLGYYYLVANKLPESKEYWNKILAIDPANATAKRALEGIK